MFLRKNFSLFARTFTTDTPLPSHEEMCGVSDTISSLTVEDVDKLLALDDISAGRDRWSILQEDIDSPLAELESNPIPLIAISRRSLHVQRDEPQFPSSIRYHKRPASDIQSSPSGIDSLDIKRPRIESEIRVEQEEFYEPSVLCFEDLVDTRMFYEFSDVRRLRSNLCAANISPVHSLIQLNCHPPISPSMTNKTNLTMTLTEKFMKIFLRRTLSRLHLLAKSLTRNFWICSQAQSILCWNGLSFVQTRIYLT